MRVCVAEEWLCFLFLDSENFDPVFSHQNCVFELSGTT